MNNGPEWARNLASSVIASSIRSRHSTDSASGQGTLPPTINIATSDSKFYGFDGSRLKPLTEAEFLSIVAVDDQRFRELNAARSLVRKRELSTARTMVMQTLDGGPADKLSSEILAEAALLQGQYSDALLALAPFLSTSNDEFLLSMAAYAGAMEGQVFDGQSHFSASIVTRGSGGLATMSETAEPSQAVANARRMSALALASWYETHNFDECAKHFYLRSLELDPANAWAAFSAGKIFMRQQMWFQASQYLKIASTRGTGMLQRLAKRELAKAHSRLLRPNIGGG